MSDFVDVPKNLDRLFLIQEFGYNAVRHYEKRLDERVRYDGKLYLNPVKTIYLWAFKDRAANRGFYTTLQSTGYNRRKLKNHGYS